MSDLGVDDVQLDLKLSEQFVQDRLHSVFHIDALASSHPVSIPVNHPDEIGEIFDDISYKKGECKIDFTNVLYISL